MHDFSYKVLNRQGIPGSLTFLSKKYLQKNLLFGHCRYGQKKPVFAYRLMAHGTMEEKIYKRQVMAEQIAVTRYMYLSGILTKIHSNR